MTRAWTFGCCAVLYGGLAAGAGIAGFTVIAALSGVLSAWLACAAVWMRRRQW